jgi:hypothetical protein
MDEIISMEIPFDMVEYLPAAVTRCRYLYPNINFNILEGAVNISFDSKVEKINREELGKELNHALYREKIYKETLGIRSSIYKASE